MSRAPAPSSISLPPAFNLADSAVDDSITPESTSPALKNKFSQSRISFSQNTAGKRAHRQSNASSMQQYSRRVSTGSRVFRELGADGMLDSNNEESQYKPVVPSLFSKGLIRKEPDVTPLPILPMVVLGIALLAELLSANVSAPFLVPMVRSFGLDSTDVGVWCGNLVASFFVTQFFTSILWATIAEQYGRRVVLFVTLLGSAITVILFGTSTTLPEAVAIRACQGVFNGAVGVARGAIRDVTDPTNEAKAYAILGFVWALGGVIGPVLGGLAESPAKNYPDSFIGKIEIFKRLPYLFPCILASVLLFTGAFLSLLLNKNGGVREGGIALPLEKGTDELNSSNQGSGNVLPLSSSMHSEAEVHLASPTSALSKGKRRAVSGSSAYGYGRRGSDSTVRTSRMIEGEEMEQGDEEELMKRERGRRGTFAERLLLANEGMGGNTINDLWVSQALAQEESVFEEEDDDDRYDGNDTSDIDEAGEDNQITPSPSGTYTPNTEFLDPNVTFDATSHTRSSHTTSSAVRSPGTGYHREYSPLSSPHHGTSSQRRYSRNPFGGDAPLAPSVAHFPGNHRFSVSGTYTTGRRFSAASVRPASIFAHTGLHSPSLIISPNVTSGVEQDPFAAVSLPAGNDLQPIREDAPLATPAPVANEKKESLFWKLPLFLIFQYFALATHDTINGQLFLSFLNTDYAEGGLGLDPAHFSILVAIMCLFQLFYQFYLYPRLGPPTGPCSHIQMFRLGSLLFIPSYITTPALRAFASSAEDGSPFLMFVLTVNMACRYAGGTLTYTAIMVCVNAMSAPEVVNLANGLAQSSVSAARVIGPIVGGYVWSLSITEGSPAMGFQIVSVVCGLALLSSFLLR
ncbi:Permease of the major facilitator superfamily [Phaffia rhodozyma]|uniref:Permease of the major facilitator superfamily n=1 Tax=Phaffia rhodozyma TaxID=264483 RepID=A0A0F7SG50_PHARH|nr:Permease of the major facilitator superfamily [Phaffia rhodozyma]